MEDNLTTEPEERIEAALVSRLASVCTVPVEGAMSPVSVGSVKELSSDTFVSVVVDLASQDLDFRGHRVPNTFSARVTVHYALCDDPTAGWFRDECRRVRASLAELTGDGCASLAADGFACDAFMIDSTSTSFDGGDNPANTKAYTATLKGRIVNT